MRPAAKMPKLTRRSRIWIAVAVAAVLYGGLIGARVLQVPSWIAPVDGVDLVVSPIVNGMLMGTLLIAAAVGLRRSRAELARSLAKTQQARDRLDEFSSAVAHDLRGPLTTISGFIRLSREPTYDDARQQEMVDRAARGALKMGEQIEDLLRRARDPHGTAWDEIDLQATVDDVVASHTSIVRDGGRIDVRQGEVVRSPVGLVRQLLSNLLANASKYGRGPDGRLHPPVVEAVVEDAGDVREGVSTAEAVLQ